ncbi:MAG: glycosyltransferase [Ilumatobacteraceae bacterium]
MTAGPLRVLIASTPVGPLGSGIGGGVELTIHSLVYGLSDAGHHVEVVAPEGSLHLGEHVHQVAGALQVSSQTVGRDAPVELAPGSVLAAMWRRVADLRDEFDVVVNMAYDWLPLYLTRFVDVPVLHLVSMGSLNDAMDRVIAEVAASHPGRLAAHTAAQAATYPTPDVFRIVGSGIVTERYDLRLAADEPSYLGVVGRISPEKGMEDVAELSARTGLTVRVWGLLQDEAYWQRVLAAHPTARLEYRGFLPTDELQAEIGGCRALVMTPKWDEAFGNVAIESMATGVPVITYDRGGPAEIVVDGETGFVVPADDVSALAAAVERVDQIDRVVCRQLVEERWSSAAFASRMAAWFDTVLTAAAPAHP